jgi:murein DD-endopeptidase MepM/ murein hydrolase activator NlpD
MTFGVPSTLPSPQPPGGERNLTQLRNAAVEFEALLLRQLTAAMNSTGEVDSDDGEEKLFGSDGGTSLAKQMFSEQLASVMAKSGGVGIADTIMKQFGVPSKHEKNAPIAGAAAAAAMIRRGSPRFDESSLFEVSPRPAAIHTASAASGEDAEIISTFEDEVRAEGLDDSLKNLVIDGKVANTTRARLAPNSPVRLVEASAPVEATLPVTAGNAATEYQMPVAGRLSSSFGNRFHPIDKRIKFHAGMDIAVPIGTSVTAAAGGTVKFAGESGGYGNLVVITHPDGRETRYGHLSRIAVAAGAEVSAGQEIGLSGSTGKSTGPHLHFEVRENGVAVDPRMITKGLARGAER